MKANAIRNFVLLLIAVILSLGIFRYHSAENVSFCIETAGCTWNETVDGQKRIGNIMVKDFGFPLVYRHTEEFTFKNQPNPRQSSDAGTTTAKIERPSFSLPSVIINVIFWFALLRMLESFGVLRWFRRTKKTATPEAQTAE